MAGEQRRKRSDVPNGRGLTAEQRARRIAVYADGKGVRSWADMARDLRMCERLFRSWAINYDKAQEREPPRPRTERACMRCRKAFMSEGAHNRMCDPCRNYAPVMDSPFIPDPDGERGRQITAKRGSGK